MKVHVDRARCIGAGVCVVNAPRVFDQGDDDGLVILRTEHPDPADAPDARKVADICPAKAVWISED
jgi:ferredoxin